MPGLDGFGVLKKLVERKARVPHVVFATAFDEFLEDAETVEAGHLDVEKNEVGGMFLDEVDRFEAIFSLRDKIDFRERFEEERKLIPGGLFVVDDEDVDGHGATNSV